MKAPGLPTANRTVEDIDRPVLLRRAHRESFSSGAEVECGHGGSYGSLLLGLVGDVVGFRTASACCSILLAFAGVMTCVFLAEFLQQLMKIVTLPVFSSI